MAIEIKTPTLGESVSEATIAKWHKKEGDFVKQDELLAELETDKVTLEVNAVASGTIKSILKKQGATVKQGEVLAILEAGGVSTVNSTTATTKPQATAKQEFTKTIGLESSGPASRKIAEESGIDASKIQGSGKDGRITKGDVIEAISGSSTHNEKREERVKMTKLRQVIAKRLKESQNVAAILTTFNEIDMSSIMALRNQYKDQFEKVHGVKLGFMSFFAKAVISALKEIPAVNAEIDGDEIVYKNYYDLGVAVGGSQGLVVPVLRDADRKNMAEIEKEITQFGNRAREGKLMVEELQGGTFTISNGGVYGSLISTPIINPPQSGILGLHKIEERPVAIKGEVKIRPMMYVALSYDHRIIDGKEAVTFLVKVKEAIEDPARLLLGV